MIADAEQLIGTALRATIPGSRIVGTPPDSRDTSWIMITQLAATDNPTLSIDHLVTHTLQLDCYAGRNGGQAEANQLAIAARAAIQALRNTTHDTHTISDTQIVGHLRAPDTDFVPARQRIILTAQIDIRS